MKRRQRSLSAKIAGKLLMGLGVLFLGGVFAAALLLQALFADQAAPDIDPTDRPAVISGR